MGLLFRSDHLQITDDWIRSAAGTFAIRDIRSVWVTRKQVGRGSRLVTALLGAIALLVILASADTADWLKHNWAWIAAAPLLFFLAAGIGLLDPVAIYLEKRHHELWIATDRMSVRLWKANAIEANKALRAIQRASERHHEQYEV